MSEETKQPAAMDVKELLRSMYGGENKRITDGNYDKTLAVECINGTFVGIKEGDILMYRGIPFVGEQPVGKNRFKKPVPYGKDEGIYEAYHFAKGSLQPETNDDLGASHGLDRVWKARKYDSV